MCSVEPLLLQNANLHPDFCNHPAIKHGLTRYLGVPIRNPQGNVIGTLCFLDGRVEKIIQEEDERFLSLLAMRVSAEVERERTIEARLAEHKAHAERLEKLNHRLEATSEERRRFVAMILHDLRHPLTALKTTLYFLQNEDLDHSGETNYYLNVMENRIESLAEQLDSLLQYNEIEAGRTTYNIEKIDLKKMICECVETFESMSDWEGIKLSRVFDPKLGFSKTDRKKLTPIILNLLANALKFTSQGIISVRAFPEGKDHWVLEIEDTGIGMRPEIQQQIFEEFYRAPDSPQKTMGCGLGLAIVRQLCSVLQGSIAVRSAPGIGTCFRLTFPREIKPQSPESECTN